MAWRDRLLRHLGPGVLGGVTMGDWLRLLRDNRFALRAMMISFQSLTNSAVGWFDSRRFRSRLKDVEVAPPLFVLGHWRSGTTQKRFQKVQAATLGL